MKIELAAKLKEQRKTKRLTIAEILSRSNIVPEINPQNVRSHIPEPTNPNEPDDKPPINIEIQPMSENPQNVSMSSSNHWGSSSSSSEAGFKSQNHSPVNADPFRQEIENIDRLGARYSDVAFNQRMFSPEAESLLNQDKGFDISDGEEVFHSLYNPHYTNWKQKRRDYIKYEQLVKMQKKGLRKYCKHSTSPTNHVNADQGPQDAEDFKK